MGSKNPPVIFISAAEQSADQHAAELIKITLSRRPDFRFVGVAGKQMVEAGCESLFDMTSHAAMLNKITGAIGHALQMKKVVREYLALNPVTAGVVIDSPTLHLPMGGDMQKRGIPVLYYISPQMWAWGNWRIYKLRHWFKKVACILPFEEKFFRDQGVDATYVGHPLITQLREEEEKFHSQTSSNSIFEKQSSQKNIILMPGSRKHVVEELLADQLIIASKLQQRFRGLKIFVSQANERVETLVKQIVNQSGVKATITHGDNYEMLESADLVITASGTNTLNIAWHKKPMIIMYKGSKPMYYLLGKWVIKTPYLSLPNILAQKEIAPEFMPFYDSVQPIIDSAAEILSNEILQQKMSNQLSDAMKSLGTQNAAENTADMLIEMVEERINH